MTNDTSARLLTSLGPGQICFYQWLAPSTGRDAPTPARKLFLFSLLQTSSRCSINNQFSMTRKQAECLEPRTDILWGSGSFLLTESRMFLRRSCMVARTRKENNEWLILIERSRSPVNFSRCTVSGPDLWYRTNLLS